MENKERLYGRRPGEIGLKRETILSFFQPVPDHGIEHISGREELKETLRTLCGECTAEQISVPDGILLCGERGTGKTYIAQAFAGDMMKKGYRFMRVHPGDIRSAWVGVTEKILAAVFE
ncbi:MAG: AAA family ATPase, partial [Clostridia bacterium]|nr:AAA family ATPase [Clostridia bacterium]